jgi:hypothetical protein
MSVKVQHVTRTDEFIAEDEQFRFYAKFVYSYEKGKLVLVSKGRHTDSRAYEPVYIPKAIYNEFKRRAYAVFFRAKGKRKKKAVNKNQMQLF